MRSRTVATATYRLPAVEAAPRRIDDVGGGALAGRRRRFATW